jgi:hypothetical protein
VGACRPAGRALRRARSFIQERTAQFRSGRPNYGNPQPPSTFAASIRPPFTRGVGANCVVVQRRERSIASRVNSGTRTQHSVGGDPAAPSGTATLLRLSPSHRARLRPLPPLRVGSRTSGAPGFHGLTGGVYKARERIHRVVADTRLLAIPASRSRVADSDPN